MLVRGMHHSLNTHINQKTRISVTLNPGLWPGQQRVKGTISSNAESCTLQVIPVLLDKAHNGSHNSSFQIWTMSNLQTQWAFPSGPETDNTAPI